jgi:catechol 2,3-dioxygenase-like lactoylglutathione lyase family enzyme
MKITGLTLQTPNLAAQREFYADSLGFPVAGRSKASFTLRAGATLLTWQQAPAGWEGFYHFAFNVSPGRFQRARAWMAAVTPLLEDGEGRDTFAFRAWNADACYFHDPSGNIGELIARQDLPHGSSGDVLCVSEIGVPVENPPLFAERLTAAEGLEIYRDSFSENFVAVGDEEGLFILVSPGRIWYPDTGKPAVVAPLQVDFLDDAGASRRLAGPPYQVVPEKSAAS